MRKHSRETHENTRKHTGKHTEKQRNTTDPFTASEVRWLENGESAPEWAVYWISLVANETMFVLSETWDRMR